MLRVIDTPHAAVRQVRVGITGHIDLGAATTGLVTRALREHLRALRQGAGERGLALVGVSCLAPGADCVFADLVLELGCTLEAILPADDYRELRSPQPDAARFAALLRAAGSVRATGWARSGPEAYAAANELMLDAVDVLVAVWNGVQSAEQGGTAHAVTRARARRMPVTVVWPPGARRG